MVRSALLPVRSRHLPSWGDVSAGADKADDDPEREHEHHQGGTDAAALLMRASSLTFVQPVRPRRDRITEPRTRSHSTRVGALLDVPPEAALRRRAMLTVTIVSMVGLAPATTGRP